MTRRLLADACALIAFFAGGEAAGMSAAGQEAMRRGQVFVSPITVWEITRKAAIGKLPAPPRTGGTFATYLGVAGFTSLPLSWRDAEDANALPPLHKDPMDRMLVAQARNNGMTVITEDTIFREYGCETVW